MTQPPPFKLAIAGLGTVGSDVVRRLQGGGAGLAQKAGRRLQLVAVAARDKAKGRGCDISGLEWCDNPLALVEKADAVVELMGGAEGAAYGLARACLGAGKPLITANKALLAHHGDALARLSEAHHAPLYCEAAVAGGIPVIKTLAEALAGNSISEVFGILNGTCNYILSTMRETGRGFAEVLREAQQLGYAEADPAFDIGGMDTAHKLAILSAIAFGTPVTLEGLVVEGIETIDAADIAFADALGYRIKLLGVARREAAGLMRRVSPYMVGKQAALAGIDGVLNAVCVTGSAVGALTLIGRGAGAAPTASAVLGDIIDCAAGRYAPPFGLASHNRHPLAALPEPLSHTAFYVRLMVADKAGVLADMAAVLRDAAISIQSLLQQGRGDAAVPVVFITHETNERSMANALAALGKLPHVIGKPSVIRIL